MLKTGSELLHISVSLWFLIRNGFRFFEILFKHKMGINKNHQSNGYFREFSRESRLSKFRKIISKNLIKYIIEMKISMEYFTPILV
jgi:hypothetical protein